MEPGTAGWRLKEHRETWQAKPALARVYGVWFEALLGAVAGAERVLEVGAGPGFLAHFARGRGRPWRWVASDYLALRWNDVAADAHRLPFRERSQDAIVGVDILHHLAAPREFFAECARVLRPRGKIVLVEPWVTPFSYVIYRYLHHERCRLHVDPWRPFAGQAATKDLLDGNAAVVRSIVKRTPVETWQALALEPPQVSLWNCFAYIATFGFRPSPLGAALPGLVEALMMLDRLTRVATPLFALRALVSWRRNGLSA